MNSTDGRAKDGSPNGTAIDGSGAAETLDLATATRAAIEREAKRLSTAAHQSVLRLLEFTEALGPAGRAELVPYAEHEIEEADLWGDLSTVKDMKKHNERVPKSIVEAFETVSDYFSE